MSREQERSKLEERINVAEQKEKRYADQMKILQHEQAQLDRKKRNHRVFTRGAILESFLRRPLVLTDDQVFQLLKIAFSSPEVHHYAFQAFAFVEKAGSELGHSFRNDVTCSFSCCWITN